MGEGTAYLLRCYGWKCWRVSSLSAEFGHMTQDTPTYGSFCGPDAVGVRHLCLCQIWSIYLYSFQSYKGGPKISKFGHVT